MADTELYVTKVRTKNGDKQIDYTALANLPEPDATLTKAGSFADSKAVGDALNKKANSTDLATLEGDLSADIINVQNSISSFQLTYVTSKGLEEKGYITEDQLKEQKYVTESALEDQGYITEAQLNDKGYVTQTQLTTNLVATVDTPGVVKPGDGLEVSDGTLSVKKHPLEDLSNIHVCADGMPDLSTIIDNHWYLVKVEE